MSTRHDAAWFRQPVLWLGAVILAATIVGCLATIVLAFRFADTPVDGGGAKAMNVPLRHAADASSVNSARQEKR